MVRNAMSVLPPSSSQQGALMQQLLFQNRHLFPAKGAAHTLTSQAQGPAIKCFNYRSMLPQGSAPAGSQKLHKQVSSTRLAVCSKRACVSVITPTDSRGTNSYPAHGLSSPHPLLSHTKTWSSKRQRQKQVEDELWEVRARICKSNTIFFIDDFL